MMARMTKLDRDIQRAYQARIAELTAACEDVLQMITKDLGTTHPATQRLKAVLLPPNWEAMGT